MRHLLAVCLLLALAVQELYAQGAFSMASMGKSRGRGRSSVRAPKTNCKLRNDRYNPFYWKGQEDICSEELCRQNPWLNCNITREYIMDQAVAHFPEDIMTEVAMMEKYFHTFFPKPRNVLPYSCRGVCQMGDKDHPRDPEEVTRVFSDLHIPDQYSGKVEVRRTLCHIIGPKIFAHRCGGPCQMPFGFGNQGNLKCVADSSVTVEAWAYCPGTYPACHKIPVTVPLSCSCHKITCNKKLPDYAPVKPKLPPFRDPAVDPFGAGGDPFGAGGDPFGAGGDPFGAGGDPFGPQVDIWGAGQGPVVDPHLQTPGVPQVPPGFSQGIADALGPLGPAQPVDPHLQTPGVPKVPPGFSQGIADALGPLGPAQPVNIGRAMGPVDTSALQVPPGFSDNIGKAIAKIGTIGAPNAGHVAGKLQDAFPLTGASGGVHVSSSKVMVH